MQVRNPLTVMIAYHFHSDEPHIETLLLKISNADILFRRSKVKCLHDGSPPCRSCHKHGRADCILTGPYGATPQPQRSNSRRPASQAVAPPRIEVNSPPETSPSSRTQNTSMIVTTPRLTFSGPERPRINESQITPVDEGFLAKVPSSMIIKACSLFNRKFPELAFLHLPTMSTEARSEPSTVDHLLLAAILALCARLLQDKSTAQSSLSRTGECYASFLRGNLCQKTLEPPSIEIVQCLLIMSFYEWGDGCGYRAWMYSG